MRLNKFESAGREPLGEGDEKKAFVDPNNEQRVISERKEVAEKDTARQLKGRYYLTKIAHLLLPKNIPDVYQAGESVDGKQIVDTERISHSPEGGKSKEELGREMVELDSELERIGVLGFNTDLDPSNYINDESGNVHYLEPFTPWEVDVVDPKELEVSFDEEALRSAIESISDQEAKEKCTQYLDRLLDLLKEERKENREKQERLEKERMSNLFDCGPGIKRFEGIIAPFLEEHVLASLHEIKSYKIVDEVLGNEERNRAKKTCNLIFYELKFLKEKTNITAEEYERLHEKYKTLNRAIGMLNNGIVDHTRE